MATTGKLVKRVINTTKSPSPKGPISQAVQVGPTLYISGNLGVDPATSEFVGPDVEAQARQALKNIQNVLEEAGMSFSNVVKTTVLLADIKDYVKANQVYSAFFKPPYPARAAYQVGHLPLSARIEIEAIAVDCLKAKL